MGLVFAVWFCACWSHCGLDPSDYRERHAKRVAIVRFIKDVACIDIISFPSRDMEPLINYFLAEVFRVRALFSILFFVFLNFYCYSITVVCIFSPSLHPTPSEPTSLPCLHPPPWFCPCVLYSSSSCCSPFFSLISWPLYLRVMTLVFYVAFQHNIFDWNRILTLDRLHQKTKKPQPELEVIFSNMKAHSYIVYFDK